MTTFPSLYFGIDFTSSDVMADPATFTYVDLSNRIRDVSPITIERGANLETGKTEPGRLTITLDNRDRALDPLYGSSPYAGAIVPMRPAVLRATSGSMRALFTGFTERWSPQWGRGRDHTVMLECVDALDYLDRVQFGLEFVLSYTTTTANEVYNFLLDIDGGRRLLLRLTADPGDPGYTITARGMNYATGAFQNESYDLSTSNYLAGVTGAIFFTSFNRLTFTGVPAGVTVEVWMMPSFVSERSDVQIGWMLDIAGWPTAARSLEAGRTTCSMWEARIGGDGYQVSDLADGDTAYSALQRIVESEGGYCYVAGNGTLTFKNRHYRILNRTPVATLGSGAGETPVILSQLPSLDSAEIRNIVRVTPYNGATQVATDTASIAKYGRRSWAKGGLLISSLEAADYAAYRLSKDKDPAPRTPKATIVGDDAYWATMLDAEIGQAFTLRQRPPNVGSYSDSLVFVDSLTWQIRRGDWRLALGFGADPGTYWILGDSTYGVLDTTTIAGY